MTELALPLLVLAASLAATYFLCLRPMRRGQCAMGRLASPKPAATDSQEAEIAALRAEIAALRSSPSQKQRAGQDQQGQHASS